MPLSSSSATVASSLGARRAALSVFAIFALNGFTFASWASRLPAIRDSLGITPGQLGLLLLVGSAGSLIALPLAGSVVDRFGTVLTTRAALVLAVAGLTTASLGVDAGQTLLVGVALAFATMGIAAWDVAMNLQGTVVERELGQAIMPRFHAGFSLGAVAGALVGAAAAAGGLPVSWHISLAVAAVAAAAWLLTSAYLPDGAMTARSHDRDTRGARRRALAAWTEPRTVLLGGMVFAAALTEGSANDWLALAVVDGFSSSDAVGAVAFGLFVGSMTLMRFAGTRLLDRYGRVPILRLSAGMALMGVSAFALVPSLPTALIAVVLWGFGAALGFPVGMSAASDDPAQSAARVSVVSSIGYLAFLAGPALLGMLADQIGYRYALLTIAIPLMGSLLLAPVAAPLQVAETKPVDRRGRSHTA